jgi:two-component sensor histidine kinase
MSADNTEPGTDRVLDHFRKQKAILVEFGKLALQDVPIDVLLQEAARGAAEGTGIDHAKILIYEPQHDDFLIRAGVGWDEGVVGKMRAPAGERSPPGRAFWTGEPVIIDDLPNDPGFDAQEPLKSHHIVSLVNVPIKNDATYGVLEVDADEKVALGEDDIDFLYGFANLLAPAIERKSADTATRTAAAALARAAAEREVLVREIEHRVANNFQAIIGAVSLAYAKAASPATREMLRDLMARIDGMAEAHSQLSAGEGPQTIRAGRYLSSLCRNLAKGHPRLRVETDIRDVEIALDRALAVGLILNELVTNALKHAFPGEAAGMVRVEFAPDPERNQGLLVVTDTGRGIGAPKQGGSGLGLMSSLAEQTGGRLERSAGPGGGTRHELRFPLANP